MICPICQDEFTPKRSDAKTCSKEKCRKAQQRLDKKNQAPDVPLNILHTNDTNIRPDKESHAQWLARRIKETGSKSSIFVKVGYPPESSPSVEIPSKYESSDLDRAIRFVREQA